MCVLSIRIKRIQHFYSSNWRVRGLLVGRFLIHWIPVGDFTGCRWESSGPWLRHHRPAAARSTNLNRDRQYVEKIERGQTTFCQGMLKWFSAPCQFKQTEFLLVIVVSLSSSHPKFLLLFQSRSLCLLAFKCFKSLNSFNGSTGKFF